MNKLPPQIKNIDRRTLLALGASGAALPFLGTDAPRTAVLKNDGPRGFLPLDDKQLGQLAFIDHLSRSLPGDWSHMGSHEPGQGYFDAYRYQLAMMSYALSLAHYHYTPAWREHHGAVSRRLIDKMLRFDVWGYWELTSQGASDVDPSLTELGDGWIDPVRYQNIMYSGHLFQMTATHEMLFGGGEFDAPGSITFDYNPFGRGLGRQLFKYDIHLLAKVIFDQFQFNGWRGVECEPNAIFPECNQHPIIGYALYDRLYGTDYFSETSVRFKEQFNQLKYLDPKSHSFMAFYQKKQKKIIRNDHAWSDGWSGTFMHAWSRPDIEEAYPIQRDRHIIQLDDGTATIKTHDGDRRYSHGHGFMATLAAELGDETTRDALLAYADRYWKPVWDKGKLIYPRRDIFKEPGDPKNVWRRLQPLTANGLIALARMGGRNRMFDMVSKPLPRYYAKQPALAGVDYPKIQVTYARYDAAFRSLDFALKAGAAAGSKAVADFVIENLAPHANYEVHINAQPAASIAKGAIKKYREPMNIAWQSNRLRFKLSVDDVTWISVKSAHG